MSKPNRQKNIHGQKSRYEIRQVIKRANEHDLVFEALDDAGKKVIIKRFPPIKKNRDAKLRQFALQAKISFKHPNIASVREYFVYNDRHYIAQDYFNSISFYEFYKKRKYRRKANTAFYITAMTEILSGLSDLHHRGVFHTDIRPQNLLVKTKQKGKVEFGKPEFKITDFGSIFIREDFSGEKRPFAFLYSAPEQVLNFPELIDASTDIYALAISFYEIISRKKAFNHSHPEILTALQLNQKLKPHKRIPEKLFSVLQKASSKHRFGLPPNRYTRSDKLQFLQEAQKQRYTSAGEMREDLQKCFKML